MGAPIEAQHSSTRKEYLSAARAGRILAFEMEKMPIDYLEHWNSEIFPSEKFFDYEVFRAEADDLTTQEEKIDITGK